jgi:hypothetical protein
MVAEFAVHLDQFGIELQTLVFEGLELSLTFFVFGS